MNTTKPLLVDFKAVCTMLSICPAHFFDLRAAGKFPIPAIRLGKSVRYSRLAVERWIDQGCPAKMGAGR